MNVLVINCGSSSLKFSVVDTSSGQDLASGRFEELGGTSPVGILSAHGSSENLSQALPNGAAHAAALKSLAEFLAGPENADLSIAAVGHRVVHGGERFTAAAQIDDEIEAAIESCSTLAPLHNPANLLGIRSARSSFPKLPQVAVFDTAFHQTLQKEAYLYPLPIDLYEQHGIRRYGFHGTSHKYVAGEAARRLGRPLEETCLITVHLGNGCSAAAIQDGRCVDTTMGLTPLEGLVMGTRGGDVDPGIILHLHRALGLSIEEIDTILNKRSGLLGLSAESNDMRQLRAKAAEGNQTAQLAIAIFIRRLAKSISALRSTVSRLDALVFTGGIGENDEATRAETIARISHLGFELDPAANAAVRSNGGGPITSSDSPSAALVQPTNEELMIALETRDLLQPN